MQASITTLKVVDTEVTFGYDTRAPVTVIGQVPTSTNGVTEFTEKVFALGVATGVVIYSQL
jgi:hypothetical protein